MRKGPNPKVFLLMAAGSFAVGGLLAFTAFNGLGAAQEHLRKLQADSKDAKALQRELAESLVSVQTSATDLQHLEAGVQDYAYVPTMLAELDKLGKASGIDVIGVRPIPKPVSTKQTDNPDGKPKRKAYDEIDIEVKGRGKYRSVMNFIEALGKFPKIVAARTVELAPKTEPGKVSTSMDVTINLRAFIFPTTPTTPTPDKKVAMTPAGNPPTGNPGGTHEG